MSPQIVAELAPHGVLRVGINLSNSLLVTGRSVLGDPEGVAPDLARAIAEQLGVPIQLVPFPEPPDFVRTADDDVWDVGLIGADPARAQKIAFTSAYVQIEATYLVPAGSFISTIEEVDRPGIRIAVTDRAAYDLWLERNIKHAQLVRSDSQTSDLDLFVRDKLEALASLRPDLLDMMAKLPAGTRILDGQFMTVQQAVGTPRRNNAGAVWLQDFIETAKASGLIATLIERHKVTGKLSVAPAG
ncbi:MAG TPA: transporter substrate-binding domain-containing protein [Acetobacteraceae bacterium]|jgi:polar amino acid transport system substrate-binding protein|nr:transporter substrate-binding domain-containing protein [Acetobacteraceae bacterium]